MTFHQDPKHVAYITIIKDPLDDEYLDEMEVRIEHPDSCEQVLGIEPYRCATEHEILDWPECWLPNIKESGTYEIQCWWSGPDHNGEYDGGCDYERIA